MALAIVDHNGHTVHHTPAGTRNTTVEIAEHAKGEVRVRIEISVPEWGEAALSAVACFAKVKDGLLAAGIAAQ